MSREEEIRERLQAATPGPWAIWEDLKDGGFVHVGNEEGVIPEGEIATTEDVEANPVAKCYIGLDALLIANVPADFAYLLAENARLRAQLDTVRELRRYVDTREPWPPPRWLVLEKLDAALNQGVGDV